MSASLSQSTQSVQFGSHDYPTADGRPLGESDFHRQLMYETIETLAAWYAGPHVYVTGNLLLFYRPGDKRRHVSPDAMVVKGVPPGPRLNYLLWEEGRSPNVVIEITSPTTGREDLGKKFDLYRTEIHVREYFLFDPKDEYLKPRLQGFRLVGDEYVPLEMVAGRLPSEELALHLEASGQQLRFYDPATGRWIPTPSEEREQALLDRERAEHALEEAEHALDQAEQERARIEQERARAEQERARAIAENARLQQELDELRRRISGENPA